MGDPSAGDLLGGRYRVVRRLSAGAMGSVLEAVDDSRGAPCALKVMLPGGGGVEEDYARRRFLEEARVLQRLAHPGVPRILDSFVSGPSWCLVMELVRGSTLLEVLRRRGGPLGAGEVIAAALEVLDVLEYLHGQDPPVVHRDIKPANLVREEPGGRIVLVDFGLACEDDGSAKTRIGTVGYCSVEQMDGRAEARSDLFSLGATMHHLLSGQAPPPYRFVPLVRFRQDLPEALMEAVATAMAPRPADRFADAAAFRDALLEARAHPSPPDLQSSTSSTGLIENVEELVERARAERANRKNREG